MFSGRPLGCPAIQLTPILHDAMQCLFTYWKDLIETCQKCSWCESTLRKIF